MINKNRGKRWSQTIFCCETFFSQFFFRETENKMLHLRLKMVKSFLSFERRTSAYKNQLLLVSLFDQGNWRNRVITGFFISQIFDKNHDFFLQSLTCKWEMYRKGIAEGPEGGVCFFFWGNRLHWILRLFSLSDQSVSGVSFLLFCRRRKRGKRKRDFPFNYK